MIAVTYHLGAAVTVTVAREDVTLVDQLIEDALRVADAALADALGDEVRVDLIGPAYVVDEVELDEVIP
jgi:hypothetical protein